MGLMPPQGCVAIAHPSLTAVDLCKSGVQGATAWRVPKRR